MPLPAPGGVWLVDEMAKVEIDWGMAGKIKIKKPDAAGDAAIRTFNEAYVDGGEAYFLRQQEEAAKKRAKQFKLTESRARRENARLRSELARLQRESSLRRENPIYISVPSPNRYYGPGTAQNPDLVDVFEKELQKQEAVDQPKGRKIVLDET